MEGQTVRCPCAGCCKKTGTRMESRSRREFENGQVEGATKCGAINCIPLTVPLLRLFSANLKRCEQKAHEAAAWAMGSCLHGAFRPDPAEAFSSGMGPAPHGDAWRRHCGCCGDVSETGCSPCQPCNRDGLPLSLWLPSALQPTGCGGEGGKAEGNMRPGPGRGPADDPQQPNAWRIQDAHNCRLAAR